MSDAAPVRHRGFSIAAAQWAAAGVLLLGAGGLAAIALTVLSPRVDSAALVDVLSAGSEGAWEPLFQRLAETDAAMSLGYWAVLSAAGALLLAAFAVFAFMNQTLGRASQRLADSIVDVSRADEPGVVWGRDRADAFGVIARTVEFMQWERLEAGAAAAAAETHSQLEVMESASAKSVRLQDALSRSVSAVSQTCNEFQGVLDRAEKTLNMASNTAWDSATARRDEITQAIQHLKAVANRLDDAAEATTARAADAAQSASASVGAPGVETQTPTAASTVEAPDAHTETTAANASQDAPAPNTDAADIPADTGAPHRTAAETPSAGPVGLPALVTEAAPETSLEPPQEHSDIAAARETGQTLYQALTLAERMIERLGVHLTASHQTTQTLSNQSQRLCASADALHEASAPKAMAEPAQAIDQPPANDHDTARIAASWEALQARLDQTDGIAQRFEDGLARLELAGAAFSDAAREPAHHAAPDTSGLDDALLAARSLGDDLAGAIQGLDAHRAAIAETLRMEVEVQSETEADRRLDQILETLNGLQDITRQNAAFQAVDLASMFKAAPHQLREVFHDGFSDVLSHVLEQERESHDTRLNAALGGLGERLEAALAETHRAVQDARDTQSDTGITEALTNLRHRLEAAEATLTDQIMTAANAMEAAARDAGAPAPDAAALAQALTQSLQAQLSPLTRLDALAAQIKLVEDRLSGLGVDEASLSQRLSDEMTAKVTDAVQAAVTAIAEDRLAPLEDLRQRLDAMTAQAASGDASSGEAGDLPEFEAPDFEPERATFRRMSIAFDLVLRDLNDQARRLGATVASVAETTNTSAPAPAVMDGEALQALSEKLDALGARFGELQAHAATPQEIVSTAPDATAAIPLEAKAEGEGAPLFDSQTTSFQRMIIGFRHVLRELDTQAAKLRDTVATLGETDAPRPALAAPEPVEGEVLPPAPAATSQLADVDRAAVNRVLDGLRTTQSRLEVEADALHQVVEGLRGVQASDSANADAPDIEALSAQLSMLMDADSPLGARLEATETRLAELAQSVQESSAETAAALRQALESAAAAPEQTDEAPDAQEAPRAPDPRDVLRSLDMLCARAANQNELMARQSDVLRSLMDGASSDLGDKAEQFVERLERAARETRSQTADFLGIAAALSRDLDADRRQAEEAPAAEGEDEELRQAS